MSKEVDEISDEAAYEGHAADTKAGGLAEAGELYGNLETAEEYGYVQRGYL